MGEPPAHLHPCYSQQLTVCFPATVRAWCASMPTLLPVHTDRADPSACTSASHPAAPWHWDLGTYHCSLRRKVSLKFLTRKLKQATFSL